MVTGVSEDVIGGFSSHLHVFFRSWCFFHHAWFVLESCFLPICSLVVLVVFLVVFSHSDLPPLFLFVYCCFVAVVVVHCLSFSVSFSLLLVLIYPFCGGVVVVIWCWLPLMLVCFLSSPSFHILGCPPKGSYGNTAF